MTRPACAKDAETFFECFAAAAKQAPGVRDPDAGAKGLRACAESQEAYERCMRGQGAEDKLKFFRVPEAYRSS